MDKYTPVKSSPVLSLGELSWERVLDLIPVDLDASARTAKALQRERKVRCGADLLRIVLTYALGDLSLRLTAASATMTGGAPMSDVAVLKRLRGCHAWLVTLVGALIRQRVSWPQRSVRVRLVDATVVSRPGSQGTDWRVHLSFNLEQSGLEGIDITDAHGAETFARYGAQPGDILVGDRIYAHARSLGAVLAAKAEVVARIGWQNLPLEADGEPLDIIRWLKHLPGALGGRAVGLAAPQGRFGLRLIACAIPQEAADRTRQRLLRVARKKGKTVDPRTLFAAGFVLVITSLPQETWSAEQVIALYRLRWQIEMLIKRLKSVLHLEHLRAQDPVLAQVYLLGKMLGALLLDAWSGHIATRYPIWFRSVTRPVSPWRLLVMLHDGLCHAVRGEVTLERILAVLPDLERYLRDSPRKRRQQCAVARNVLSSLATAQAP